MKNTLQKLLIQCLQDSKKELGNYNVEKYPSQILCLAEGVNFTEKIESCVSNGSLEQLRGQLKQVLDKYTSIDYATSADPQLTELKYKALIMDVIHCIEVVELLAAENVRGASEWHFQRQLRFYVNKRGMATIRMVDAEFEYTYEYQGNAPKLVHTPLTDKCYLTLTQGMHMGFGGNPYGPAGNNDDNNNEFDLWIGQDSRSPSIVTVVFDYSRAG